MRLLTILVKRRVVWKQALIRKLLVKSRALYRSLAFLTRFTNVGHEPHLYEQKHMPSAASEGESFGFYQITLEGTSLREPIWFAYDEVELIALPAQPLSLET
jgi:hypothetical protein